MLKVLLAMLSTYQVCCLTMWAHILFKSIFFLKVMVRFYFNYKESIGEVNGQELKRRLHQRKQK